MKRGEADDIVLASCEGRRADYAPVEPICDDCRHRRWRRRSPVRTLTGIQRAAAATALGLVLSLSLVGCSLLLAESPTEAAGCSLAQFHGDLVADNGRVLFSNTQTGEAVPLDWGEGYTTRPSDGEQLEVAHIATGIVRARTGTRVILLTPWDPDGPVYNSDGEFVVCDVSPG